MRELAMFPLGSPVVPHSGVPLQVFEDRYRVLLHDVLAGDRRFGTTMIKRGSEVGGGDHRSDIGALVEVVGEKELEDGRWALLGVGVGRIRVVDWLDDDPYPRAMVEDLADTPFTGDTAVRDEIENRVRRVAALVTELGEPAPPVAVRLADDPVVAAWQAVAVTPIGPLDTQRLLEMDDSDRRVEATVEALEDAEELLRFRLAG